ncbi:hypothetical protein [Actinomadura decatromicini]|uniref:LPXTG cell wall anchor domain-containing protein n=1 Tax=Actinomadura decatromicini TaxID=2604572 RepID=A0A5D3FM12_9ACTN|nr:hypothetical protein [Actinomadura decatromicini]TYK49341.1 hypothetical protein FXF68_16330 [Actinomadura decatromicini]
MHISARRIAASGTLALALTPALALTAVPAHAQVDLDAVAEGITESGYYVDSHAKYYQSDGAQELLRTAQGRSVAVFIAIVPAGNDPAAILQRLPGLMHRKGTYAVLAGDQLKVSSNALPDAQVKSAYTKAVAGAKGKPDLALLHFVRTLPESKYAPPKPGKPGNNGKPAPAAQTQQEERTLAQSQPTGPATGSVAASPKDDGGSAMPFVLGGGGLVVVAAAAGGFLLLRKRSAKPAAAGAPAGGGQPLVPPAQPAADPGEARAEAAKPEPPKDA